MEEFSKGFEECVEQRADLRPGRAGSGISGGVKSTPHCRTSVCNTSDGSDRELTKIRERLSRLDLQNSNNFKDLDTVTKAVLDAVVKQEDIFVGLHNTGVSLMKKMHSETLSRVEREHESTRREIIEATALNIHAESEATRKLIQDLKVREFSEAL